MLQALGVAAGDASPAVVSAALDALQPVTQALYRRCAALHDAHVCPPPCISGPSAAGIERASLVATSWHDVVVLATLGVSMGVNNVTWSVWTIRRHAT